MYSIYAVQVISDIIYVMLLRRNVFLRFPSPPLVTFKASSHYCPIHVDVPLQVRSQVFRMVLTLILCFMD